MAGKKTLKKEQKKHEMDLAQLPALQLAQKPTPFSKAQPYTPSSANNLEIPADLATPESKQRVVNRLITFLKS